MLCCSSPRTSCILFENWFVYPVGLVAGLLHPLLQSGPFMGCTYACCCGMHG
jgi:hypothetical protein